MRLGDRFRVDAGGEQLRAEPGGTILEGADPPERPLALEIALSGGRPDQQLEINGKYRTARSFGVVGPPRRTRSGGKIGGLLRPSGST